MNSCSQPRKNLYGLWLLNLRIQLSWLGMWSPAKLEDVGISKSTFEEHLGLGGYVCKDQQPFLFYASTYVPFETENYDFTKHEWRHVYD